MRNFEIDILFLSLFFNINKFDNFNFFVLMYKVIIISFISILMLSKNGNEFFF